MSIVPWVLIGATQAWLHLAAATPPQWAPVVLEGLAFAWMGFALHRLGSLRASWLAHPLWAAAVPLWLTGVAFAPSGFVAVPFLVGWSLLVAGPAWWAAQRVPVPWWAVAAIVPPLVLGTHVYRAVSADLGNPDALFDRISREVQGPFWRATTRGHAEGLPIVLITVDTLRADDAQRMETWKRLASRGAWWQAAQSTSSWTLPAMASLLTGTGSSTHGAGCLVEGFCQGMDPDVATLSEHLRGAGYATVGISANPWAGRRNGFDRGFDRFHDLGADPRRGLLLSGEAFLGPHAQDGQVVIDTALSAIDDLAGGGAFFLWVHLIDPHLPYVHVDDADIGALGAEAWRNANIVPPAQRSAIREAYRSQVDYADTQLERLLDRLAALPSSHDMIIVFTSDHGEEFWEHGGVEHGHSHHAEVVEVPLVFAGAQLIAGQHHSVVSLVDVVPTMLGTLGLASPRGPGRDLHQEIEADRVVTAEGNLHHRPACSAVSLQWRVIREDCAGPTERINAYDRIADPGEFRPLPAEGSIREHVEGIVAPQPRGATWQSAEGLEALGYVDPG